MHLTPEETTALETAFPPLNDRTLQRMRARLNRWELMHLRQHAAHLAQQLEDERSRSATAEAAADYWRDQVMAMQEDLADDMQLCIARDGSLSIQTKSQEQP
jgi:hypothetical protein